MAETSGPIEGVLGVVRTAAETATEFKTIADKFIADWGLGAKKESAPSVSTPGRPVNPTVYNYPSQWSKESLDQKIGDVRSALTNVGTQIKGLFNLAYESPTGGQTAAAIAGGPASTGGAGIAGIPTIWLIAGAVLLFVMWRKR